MLNKFGGVRRIAVLALFGAVWFFRDWAATTFDQQEREAQQVISEKAEHQQRQAQNADQRQVLKLLSFIALEQGKMSGSVSDEQAEAAEARLWSKEAKDAGVAMVADVTAFRNLLARVENDPKRKDHEDLATEAEGVAGRLKNQKPLDEDDDVAAVEALEDEWIKVDAKLGTAWDELELAAQTDQANASGTASFSRMVAWIGSIISALLMGDWSKALTTVTGGTEPEKASSASA